MPPLKENALVLYAKYPIPGKVKTRLIQDPSGLKPEEASDLYLAILKDLLQTIHQSDSSYDLYLCILSHVDEFRGSFGTNWSFLPDNGGGDLGLSLFRTFQNLKRSGYEKLVIMGSDLPYITIDQVEDSFAHLDACSFVLGPDQRGGCYLMGARDAYPVFQDIPWSEGKDFQILKNRLSSRAISTIILPEVEDLDTLEDFYLLRKRYQADQELLKKNKPQLSQFLELFHVKQ